jgi:hypothetical protein
MGEDPLNDGRVVDRGDELHSSGATRTAQDVQVERSAHQRRPCQDNKTPRDAQVAEIVRRVYRLEPAMRAKFKQNLSEIFKYRDLAVHPSSELKRTCTRPDIPVGIDWKFSTYRYTNAEKCFRATMGM